MRALGIDLGSKRIGVAVSDGSGTLASALTVVERSGDQARDHRRLLEIARDQDARCLVVGLPISLDGSLGPAAVAAQAEVEALRACTELPVETYDERLTTVTAERLLRAQGVRGPRRRQLVDQVAAAVMLQAWLDGRPAPEPDRDPEHPS